MRRMVSWPSPRLSSFIGMPFGLLPLLYRDDLREDVLRCLYVELEDCLLIVIDGAGDASTAAVECSGREGRAGWSWEIVGLMVFSSSAEVDEIVEEIFSILSVVGARELIREADRSSCRWATKSLLVKVPPRGIALVKVVGDMLPRFLIVACERIVSKFHSLLRWSELKVMVSCGCC